MLNDKKLLRYIFAALATSGQIVQIPEVCDGKIGISATYDMNEKKFMVSIHEGSSYVCHNAAVSKDIMETLLLTKAGILGILSELT